MLHDNTLENADKYQLNFRTEIGKDIFSIDFELMYYRANLSIKFKCDKNLLWRLNQCSFFLDLPKCYYGFR